MVNQRRRQRIKRLLMEYASIAQEADLTGLYDTEFALIRDLEDDLARILEEETR